MIARWPAIPFFPRRHRHRLLPCAIWLLSWLCAFTNLFAAEVSAFSSQGYVESAVYRARLEASGLVDGHAEFQLRRRGSGPAQLDWTSSTLALSDLSWENGKVEWGTDGQGQVRVIIDRDAARATARWSAHPISEIGEMAFELVTPPALRTQFEFTAPARWTLTATRGVVSASADSPDSSTRRWTVELGNESRTALIFRDSSRLEIAPPLLCETTVTFIARRDGLTIRQRFVLSDDDVTKVMLPLPADARVRSVFVNDVLQPAVAGVPSRILQLPLPRQPTHTGQEIVVDLELPKIWAGRQEFPALRLDNSRETSRKVALQVEAPLELRAVDAQGLYQTGLQTIERGEEWQFEARERYSRLVAEIEAPVARESVDWTCVMDLRRPGGWAAGLASFRVEAGEMFSSRILLPADWDVVTVEGHNVDSQVAAYSLQGTELLVTWSRPVARGAERQLRLFFTLPEVISLETWQLPAWQFPEAQSGRREWQLILPDDRQARLIEARGWRSAENVDLAEALRAFPEVRQRLPDPSAATILSLETQATDPAESLRIALRPRPVNDRQARSEVRSAQGNLEQIAGKPAIDLRIQSTCGPFPHVASSHVATLTFSEPITLDQLHLHLSDEAKLSTVSVDGIPVQVIRTQSGIEVPADSRPLQQVQLSYQVSPQQSWWTGEHVVPLPGCDFPIANLNWTVDLVGEPQLAAVRVPALGSREMPVESITSCLFGPLTRSGDERLFQPWSALDWSTLFTMSRTPSEFAQPRRVYQAVLPDAAGELHMITWDRRRALEWSWIGFWLAGLFTLWIRRSRPAGGRGLLLLICLLSVLLIWIPPTATPVIGGLLIGVVLTILLPRRWVLPKTKPVHREQLPTFSWRTAFTMLAIGLAGVLAPAALPQAGAQPASASAGLPDWLIRSARYALTTNSGTWKIRATFELLVRSQNQSLVRLPILGVIFNPQSARLDGAPVELIPSTDEQNVFVRLPAVAKESAAVASDFVQQLELEFDLPSQPGFAGATLRLPRVPDSTLTADAEIPISSLGAQALDDGHVLALLGPLSKLVLGDAVLSESPLSGARAVTRLDLAELNIAGLMRIFPPATGFEDSLSLPFPAGCRIKSVTGDDTLDWHVLGNPQGSRTLSVQLRKTGSHAAVDISFDVVPEFHDNRMVVPAFRMFGSAGGRHLIGIQGPAGLSVVIDDGSAPPPVTAEAWQSSGLAEPGRAANAIELTEPRELPLIWARQEPIRAAAVSETLTLSRNRWEWEASAQVNVTRAVSYWQRFQVSERVNLAEVRVLSLEGNQQTVRFTREGAIVTAFLPGGQLGVHNIELQGTLDFRGEDWFNVPRFAVLDTQITSSDWKFENRSDWLVDADFSGDPATPPERTAQRLEEAQEFPFGTPRPVRLRPVLPAWAVRTDEVISVDLIDTDVLLLRTQLRLSPAETPMQRITLRIPPEWEETRILNLDVEASTSLVNGSPVIQVRVPDRLGLGLTLNLSSRCRVPRNRPGVIPREIPLLEVSEVSQGSQFIVVPREAPFTLDSTQSLRISGASFPTWADAEFRDSLQQDDRVCWQPYQPQRFINLVPRPVENSSTSVVLEETAVWPQSTNVLLGATRIWLGRFTGNSLLIQHDTQTRLTVAQGRGKETLPLKKVDGGTLIELGGVERPASLSFQWEVNSPTGMWELFRYGGTLPDQRLCAVSTASRKQALVGQVAPLDVTNAWLARWLALMQCVQPSAVAIDDELLANIRLARNESASQMNAPPEELAMQQQSLYQALTERWAALQEELYLPAPGRQDPRFPLTDGFVRALRTAEGDVPAQLLLLPREQAVLAFHPILPSRGALPQLLLTAAAFLLCGLGWTFPRQLSALRSAVAESDLDGILVLEGTWWSLLTGSGFAFLALVVTISYVVVHRLGTRFTGSRSPEDEAIPPLAIANSEPSA